ncbi:ABC transporter substrate-binding protein [bacterium]|nr:ABC transporter substrate-binding protein [bacterium]
MRSYLAGTFLILALLKSGFTLAAVTTTTPSTTEKVLTLYHDADWSNHTESAQSIWRGVETALSQVDYRIQGYRIELVKKDHIGNVALSRKNMTDFMADKQALAIISGIHSPPLIKYRTFINENKLLTLVPWAAGGPITRHPSTENWVFRASVDDTKAGEVLVSFALNKKGCKAPHLLLENTPWGHSNLKSMSLALNQYGQTSIQTTRFDWNMKGYTAKSKLQSIIEQGADCILLVSNSLEGAEIALAMASMLPEKRLPIISHWGITAGHFHKTVNKDVRQGIDVSFIQSCFSFMQKPLSSKGDAVLSQAKKLFPEAIKAPIDIRSPVGFIHGYDITLLLLQALKQVTLTDDMLQNRDAVRKALEDLNQPVEGLVKTYEKPFSVFSDTNNDAHEALGIKDYCMANYGLNDEIILLTDN